VRHILSSFINFNFYLLKNRVHVRRGTKILWEANAVSLENYMRYVKDFYQKYFLNYPEKIGKINRTVYLVTEDLTVLNEALFRL
jgi:hypothetical protein